jgi:hypothetical protein
MVMAGSDIPSLIKNCYFGACDIFTSFSLLVFLCAYFIFYSLNDIISAILHHFTGCKYQQKLAWNMMLTRIHIPSLMKDLSVWSMRHLHQLLTPCVFCVPIPFPILSIISFLCALLNPLTGCK